MPLKIIGFHLMSRIEARIQDFGPKRTMLISLELSLYLTITYGSFIPNLRFSFFCLVILR